MYSHVLIDNNPKAGIADEKVLPIAKTQD
jgi:hypothetical protein